MSEPDDPIALLQSGIYLVKHGRYQESIENLERFVRISRDPREITSAYRYLGVAYGELRNSTPRE